MCNVFADGNLPTFGVVSHEDWCVSGTDAKNRLDCYFFLFSVFCFTADFPPMFLLSTSI